MKSETLKGQLALVKKQAKKYSIDNLSDTGSEDNEQHDRVVETENTFIKRTNDQVYLKSPTFGDVIKIKNPVCKFGSSENAFKELKHIEEQIQRQGVMPDFGYAEDNYILQGHNSNKWKLLVGLLNDQEKFKWLMSYIKVEQLRKVVSKAEETEVLKNRQKREMQMKLEQEMQMQRL